MLFDTKTPQYAMTVDGKNITNSINSCLLSLSLVDNRGFDAGDGASWLIAESPVKVLGFKVEIESQNWIATRVTHNLDQNGLTTQVECETNIK